MSKFSVKKPFTVLVGIIMVLVLGFVSFTNLTTDLLPEMSLPYILVITTYPGASPELVENDVTEPLESALGTVNGVENVTSVSNENYSMVILEFETDTNMDSAMVKLSSQVNLMTLPDSCGTPMLIEMSPDMMATMMVAVDYEDMDIYELTDFADEVIVPELERQEGVASVSVNGMVDKYVEVRLNQDKIDEVNKKLLTKVKGTLSDSEKEIADAREELEDAKSELKKQQNSLPGTQSSTASQLAQASKLIDQAVATQSAYQANLAALQANQMALTAEKEAYQDGLNQIDQAIQAAYAQADASIHNMSEAEIKAEIVNGILGELDETSRGYLGLPASVDSSDAETLNTVWSTLYAMDGLAESMDTALESAANVENPLPKNLEEALANDGEKLAVLQNSMITAGQEEAAAQLDYATIQSMKTRISEIDIELDNLKTEITVAQTALEQVNDAVKEATDQYESVESGKITAAAGFGSATAQLSAGMTQIENGLSQLDSAEESLDSAKETALNSANLDSMLTMSTLSGILTAQNFDMPAGYITEDEDQYLLKVGEKYATIEELEKSVLTRIDEIGDIKLKDVADITVLDNSGDSYSKVNGNPALMISITKSSTAGTSAVAKACNKAMDQMSEKYEGLEFTNLMDQGEYIGIIIDSVLSNLIWGALLAIIVLIIFLKDPRPTLVIAFSIPLSVLTAIVLMYFTGMTLNIISLSGLALGVGMLVDNSVVVIENIYRMRSLGVPAARAAVKGSKQVTGAIIASTLTTVCVFLPIVFTSGLARQLFTDMGLTIAFSLCASVVVALTVVPAMSATILKDTKEKKHPIFDRMLDGYEKALRFCLRFKVVPLAIALVLLGFCGYQVTQIGMTLIPSMGGTQMSMSMTAPDGTSTEDAYAKADEFMEMAMNLEGMDKVGMMDGGSAVSSILGGSLGDSSGSGSSSFTVYMLVDEDAANDTTDITTAIEDYFADSDWTYTLSTSNMDMSSLLASGLEVEITGRDIDTLIGISEDVMEMVGQVEGFEEISNGQEDGDPTYKLIVNKKKAMRKGLTVAQIYQTVASALTTDTTSVTLTLEDEDYEVHFVDERDPVTLENILDYEIETTVTDEDGNQATKSYPLKKFCTLEEVPSVASISRSNQVRYVTVTASTADGYNTTLLSRKLEELLDDYEVPDGYTVTVEGESESVMETLIDILKMIGLACIFIYLIMVAQFQSLLSPFIVIFTIPLAFTGGLLALLVTGEQLSMIAMMGFLVLSGVVVNNGIVFVDYVNQLRLAGIEKKEALVRTGKTRMRPILMTALTTIFAMCTMAFDNSYSGAMGKGMAIVTVGGLAYATLMTLFIIPVLYDIFFRREMHEVDLGDLESLEDDSVL